MRKLKGLRRRWLANTLGVVFALGLICVLLITTVFSLYYYASLESDLSYRARITTEFFSGYWNLDDNAFYQNCMNYATSFEDRNGVALQFIDPTGQLVATSHSQYENLLPTSGEIESTILTMQPNTYVGKDPSTGERIMAVSSPMVHLNGEVAGVLRLLCISGPVAICLVISSAAPAAASVNMLAITYKQDVELAAKTVSMHTIVAMLTMPVLIALVYGWLS